MYRFTILHYTRFGKMNKQYYPAYFSKLHGYIMSYDMFSTIVEIFIRKSEILRMVVESELGCFATRDKHRPC